LGIVVAETDIQASGLVGVVGEVSFATGHASLVASEFNCGTLEDCCELGGVVTAGSVELSDVGIDSSTHLVLQDYVFLLGLLGNYELLGLVGQG
jgi:hypothetical protein